MLELKNIYKTFNAGTVNEKQALKGIDLTLEDGDFVTGHWRKWCRKIHHVECNCRCMAG